jgi:DNA replication protein DnaC
MERTQIFDLMGELKLYGMKAAFDEIMATAIKRQHEPQRIVGDLLTAEISEKQARSIKYQLTIAKLPLAKDIDDFQFDGTPMQGRLAEHLTRMDFIVLDELGYLPFAQSGGQLLRRQVGRHLRGRRRKGKELKGKADHGFDKTSAADLQKRLKTASSPAGWPSAGHYAGTHRERPETDGAAISC